MDQNNQQSANKTTIMVGLNIKKWFLRLLIISVIIAAGIYFHPKIYYLLSHESTDDAYITGTVIPVSAEIKGKAVQVWIKDNQYVKSGDLMLKIDDEEYLATARQAELFLAQLVAEVQEIEATSLEIKGDINQTRAAYEEAKIQRDLTRKDENRSSALFSRKSISQSDYDNVHYKWLMAVAHAEAARAAISKAEAALQNSEAKLRTQKIKIDEAKSAFALANLNLKRTEIKAPVSGWIANRAVDIGRYVQPGQALLTITKDEELWVVANFKETQIGKMKVGQSAKIEMDTYPGIMIDAKVESFQPGTGAVFMLLPPENATGNFIKVVQRVPVKIVMNASHDPARHMYPGLSVIVHVDVSQDAPSTPR